jgi:hypothetical protein
MFKKSGSDHVSISKEVDAKADRRSKDASSSTGRQDGDKSRQQSALMFHKFAAGQFSGAQPSKFRTDTVMRNLDTLDFIMNQPNADMEGPLEKETPISTGIISRGGFARNDKDSRGQVQEVGHDVLFPHVTPLMQAVLHSNLKAVELLVHMGADINATLPCDLKYEYRYQFRFGRDAEAEIPVIPKGSTVLMMAMYKLFGAFDTLSMAAAEAAASVATNGNSEPTSKGEVSGSPMPVDMNKNNKNKNTDTSGSNTPNTVITGRGSVPKITLKEVDKAIDAGIICDVLLGHREINIHTDCVQSTGSADMGTGTGEGANQVLVSAITIAGDLVEHSRGYKFKIAKSTDVAWLSQLPQRVLARALDFTLPKQVSIPVQPLSFPAHGKRQSGTGAAIGRKWSTHSTMCNKSTNLLTGIMPDGPRIDL